MRTDMPAGNPAAVPDRPRRSRQIRRATLVVIALAAVLIGPELLTGTVERAPGVEAGFGVVTSFSLRPSHDGLYQAQVVATRGPVVPGRPADWIVRVGVPGTRSSVEARVTATAARVDDDGEPVRVNVSAAGEPGDFRLERVRFDRPGWWTMHLTIESMLGVDSLAFNVSIPAPAGRPRSKP